MKTIDTTETAPVVRACPDCGKQLKPCPARFDGQDTFVGYYPCICSRAAWLESDVREWGISYEEYLENI